MVNIDEFIEIRDCIYKDEHYSVRDNGAIMRHQRNGLPTRKLDEVWTFGNPDLSTGYMVFCGERVHRIVATAFHGEAPSYQHVVDHIDTNRRNNRPENLRWLTKLENILNNEITRKKVELICGSVEAFLENPSLLFGYETEDPNFSWMRTVSPEEAKNCLENWRNWAKTATPNQNNKKEKGNIGDWIFEAPINRDFNRIEAIPNFFHHTTDELKKIETENIEKQNDNVTENEMYDDLYESLTPTAKQRDWRTPTEFPFCPTEVTADGLTIYKNNLKEGDLFSSNVYDNYYVIDRTIRPEKEDLIVLCTNKNIEGYQGTYALCSIRIEKDKFVHMSIRRYAYKDVASRYYKLIIGEEEWTEEDYIMCDT